MFNFDTILSDFFFCETLLLLTTYHEYLSYSLWSDDFKTGFKKF